MTIPRPGTRPKHELTPPFTLHVETLVCEAQNGSPEAFNELCTIYRTRLLRKLLTITKQREDAEDALQNAYLRAYIALDSFEGRSSFGSWMTRIAINCALQNLRKRKSRVELLIVDEHEADEANGYCDPPDPAPSPEEQSVKRQIETRMQYAISRLPARLRGPLELQIQQDISAQEIAQRLGISHSAVKSRLMRARSRIHRNALEGRVVSQNGLQLY